MPRLKAGELRDKPVDELRQREDTLREQLFKLRFQKATGQGENPQKIGFVRKDLARILTVIREKTGAGAQ